MDSLVPEFEGFDNDSLVVTAEVRGTWDSDAKSDKLESTRLLEGSDFDQGKDSFAMLEPRLP
jgi:hypothetical protein